MRVALYDHVQRMPHRLLHPDPDRQPAQPHEQRRGRRAGHRHHAGHGDVRRLPAHQRAVRDAATELAGHAVDADDPAADHRARPPPQPAKWSALSRVRMQLNGEMGATMQERFNVSGALLVKLFGRRKDDVDDFSVAGRRRARQRHPTGDDVPPLLRGPHADGCAGHGRRLLARRPRRHRTAHSAAARSSPWPPMSAGCTRRSPTSRARASTCSPR